MVIRLFFLLSSVLFIFSDVSANDELPLQIKHISTEELVADFSDILIVDVRSKMEFDIAHINGAKHVDLSKTAFVSDLEQIRERSGDTKLVLYCNGHECRKSSTAYQKAVNYGFRNIEVYDAGIFDWIKSHPEKATLMGKTPASSDKIISKSEFKMHMIDFDEMRNLAIDKNSVVIDIRDSFQRSFIPNIENLRNIPLDQLIVLVKNKQLLDKNLLIIDAVGEQVRWLQYYLVDNGYTNYKFLENGIEGTL